MLGNEFISQSPDWRPLDMFPHIQRCALEVILEASMGVQVDLQHGPDVEYMKATQSFLQVVEKRRRTPWYSWDSLFQLSSLSAKHQQDIASIKKFTHDVIASK